MSARLSGIEAKAVELICHSQVVEIPSARVFHVAASEGDRPHRVVLYADDYCSCDCPAGRREVPCSHSVAARFQAHVDAQNEATS